LRENPEVATEIESKIREMFGLGLLLPAQLAENDAEDDPSLDE
jgi:hypothetical protein